MRWFGVKSDDIHRWQHAAEPFIRKACQHGDGDVAPSDIFRACRHGSMQLWLVYDDERGSLLVAAVVTSIIDAPRQKRCLIAYLGGEGIWDWIHFLGQIEAWAKEQGCTLIDMRTRPGMEKILPGYSRQAVVLRKSL